MKTIALASHNGQLHLPKVRHRLRRKIQSAIRQHECVLLDGDEARISGEELSEITADLPENQFKIIKPSA